MSKWQVLIFYFFLRLFQSLWPRTSTCCPVGPTYSMSRLTSQPQPRKAALHLPNGTVVPQSIEGSSKERQRETQNDCGSGTQAHCHGDSARDCVDKPCFTKSLFIQHTCQIDSVSRLSHSNHLNFNRPRPRPWRTISSSCKPQSGSSAEPQSSKFNFRPDELEVVVRGLQKEASGFVRHGLVKSARAFRRVQ